VYRRMGCVQPRLPLPLYLAMVENTSRVSSRQPGVGLPEVWSLDTKAEKKRSNH